jgi:similar to stage IV sporulation protein
MWDYLNMIFRGYVTVSIDSKISVRFFNICRLKRVKISGIESMTDSAEVSFRTSIKNKEMLVKIAEKTGTDIKLEECGLNCICRRIRNKLVILGVFLSVCTILYIQNLFIWRIEITGLDTTGDYAYTNEEISDYLATCNIKTGMLKKDVEKERIESLIKEKYPKVIWISVYTKGTCLYLDMEVARVYNNYGGASANISDVEKNFMEYCNIVADRDCIIKSIITSNGTPVVSAGDEVSAGDILISGSVSINDDSGDTIRTKQVKASGVIYVYCDVDYDRTYSYSYYSKEPSGETGQYKSIVVGRLRLDMGGEPSGKSFEKRQEQTQVCFFNKMYLPIYIINNNYSGYNLKETKYTEEELRIIADSDLNYYIDTLQEKGVQIVEKNVKIITVGETLKASGTIRVVTQAGVPAELHEVPATEQ